MTKLQQIICPICRNKQLYVLTNNLIQNVCCNNCGQKQQLCNLLGSK